MASTTRRAVVRLTDVARAAGVSPSIASRVLNGDPAVSVRPETAERIRQAAQTTGYRPNELARALRGQRTGALGMVVPLVSNPVWTAVQAGALQRAEELGYLVMLTGQRVDASKPIAEFTWLVEQSRVDGLMFATALRTHPAADPGVPHVFLNRRGPRRGNDVVMDEAAAVRLVVEHAVARGHHRLLMLDGTREIDTVWRRVAAARRLATRHRLRLEVVCTEQTERQGYLAGVRVAGSADRPTLCMVGSTNQLVGLMAGLRHGGLAVPGDVSLVCFDDDDSLGYLDVGVTAVSMPLAALGAAGVEALLRRIEGGPATDVVLRDPMTLTERDSVAKLG